MTINTAAATADPNPFSGSDDHQRRRALLRLLAYARDEARRLDADVLTFCLDASLSIARGEFAPDRAEAGPVERQKMATPRKLGSRRLQ